MQGWLYHDYFFGIATEFLKKSPHPAGVVFFKKSLHTGFWRLKKYYG